MHFLADVWVTCDACKGRRYTEETLEVKYHGYSIHQVLEMPIYDAAKLFSDHPRISRILKTLSDVGLDYVALGQAAPTLSGGEAQRVKLAAELSRPDTGKTLYLLDEPTTGLHFEDIAKLLTVLHRLVDLGNTVVVIEHNLDVIKSADWIIDMGPEAGLEGGQVVFTGTPEGLVEFAKPPRKSTKKAKDDSKGQSEPTPKLRSYTGEALAPVLKAGPHAERSRYQESYPTSNHDSANEKERI
jgi:excinuclease ABC subunit A